MNIIPDHMWNRVPEGWYGFNIPQEVVPLVIEFDEKIKALFPTYKIHQIKEKFWTLRIYIDMDESDPTDEQCEEYLRIIDEYEKKGTEILERVRERGRRKTLC